jgi:presenilin-like A22 family membrane protease
LAFVSAEFRSDFAAKHLFVMRFMLIFIHTLILIYILITILSDPIDPPHILLVLIIMIPLSYPCFVFVSIISTIVATIICISWFLTITTFLVLACRRLRHQWFDCNFKSIS